MKMNKAARKTTTEITSMAKPFLADKTFFGGDKGHGFFGKRHYTCFETYQYAYNYHFFNIFDSETALSQTDSVKDIPMSYFSHFSRGVSNNQFKSEKLYHTSDSNNYTSWSAISLSTCSQL